MEHMYIFVADKVAYQVIVANCDLANGRYVIFSTAMNNIHGSIYESIEEVEKAFDLFRERGAIDEWYYQWNKDMGNSNRIAFSLK